MQGRRTETARHVNKSLRRGLQILDVFDEANDRLTATDIARRLNTLPGTIYPSLCTLEQSGYLVRDEHKRYALGLRLLGFTDLVQRRLDLRDVAAGPLRELATRHSVNAHLAVLYEDVVLYLHREEGTPTVVIKEIVGARVPAYCTALGKVLLSGIDDEALRAYLATVKLVSHTESTITDRDRLDAEIRGVRERGYAVDDEEFHVGGLCFAAPVFDYRGRLIAAISLSVPKTWKTDRDRPSYIRIVQAAAEDVSRRLGCRRKEVA